MIPLTYEVTKSYEMQKVCYISEKNLVLIRMIKSQIIVITGAAHNICNLRYKIPKEILVVFHNGCTYDYHFIIKQLAKEFVGEFECLGEIQRNILLFQPQLKKT